MDCAASKLWSIMRNSFRLGVAKADAPVRAVAERLVLRLAAPAERVVLVRGAVAERHLYQLDAAGNRIWPVVGHRHHRRTILVAMLDAVDRIAERARRALPDRRHDL